MRTLEVTDEQYAFIQHLRGEISEEVVGKYGFVREQDAVQFLIDNLADDVEIDGDFDSSATDDVAASVGAAIAGDDTDDGTPDLEAVSYVESEEADDTGDEAADESDGAVGPVDGVGSEDGDGGSSESADDDEGDDAAEAAEADEASEDDENDEGDEGDGAADDDDMLNEMMSLLETHDDKWEESSSADYRYSVTLPDGTVEEVQTKDDVRALLFKNYR